MTSSKNNFDFVANSSGKEHTITVKVLRQEASLWDLVNEIYDFIGLKQYSCFDDVTLVYVSPTGKTYTLTQHAVWMNPVTILSDLSRQLQL